MLNLSLKEIKQEMLKKVQIDILPNGRQVTIPSEVNVDNFDQQVKRFIEVADHDLSDGQMHISLFRNCHGGDWTIKILMAIILELHNPQIYLEITHARDTLLPFFEFQLERHRKLDDTVFKRSGRRPSLPI
jgi:hypothetical protein